MLIETGMGGISGERNCGILVPQSRFYDVSFPWQSEFQQTATVKFSTAVCAAGWRWSGTRMVVFSSSLSPAARWSSWANAMSLSRRAPDGE
jgi:hypothetical protein